MKETHVRGSFSQEFCETSLTALADLLPYLDKLPTDPDELFQVDLYPMILSYIKRMQAADINEWEDKSHIRLAKVVFGCVMAWPTRKLLLQHLIAAVVIRSRSRSVRSSTTS
jgi:hypothetical protein